MQNNRKYFIRGEFQQFISTKRKVLGLKQCEMARLTDIEPDVYRKYESGKCIPNEERGNHILRVLQNYETEVYNKQLDEAIYVLQEMKNHNYLYINHKKGLLSAINKFIKAVNDIM